MRVRPVILFLAAYAAVSPSPALAESGESLWRYQTYVDAGYVASNRTPSNNEWRSKSTTAVLNDPQLFLVMGNVRKDAVPESRWGIEFGMQAGADSERLVTAPPPPAKEPVSNADTLRHFYRANASWHFGEDRGVRLTGGLIDSYIGYESYLAIDNPNYTRGYLLDEVPYFLTGLEAAWDVSESVDLGFYLVDGYDYLTDPNDVPSTGFQVAYKITPAILFKQNFYYGPDQADTSIEYWRFLSDTIFEWKGERFLVAGAFDYGTERQAYLPGQPRFNWAAGAIWFEWTANDRISAAFRPEFYRDDDGLITGAKQRIQAYTATFKYEFSPLEHRLVGTFELRYDRSTGEEGGFATSPDDRLVADQAAALFGVLWSFGP